MIDDDRILDVIGVGLVIFIALAIGVLVLAGATAPERELPPAPEVDWTIERVGTAEVAIVHAGGEPVDASQLVVAVAGVEHPANRSDRLTEGEAIGAPARRGQSVKLYWVAGRDARVRLASWEAP